MKNSNTTAVSKHPLYLTWRGIINRTRNPKHFNYHKYGGAGINICEEWYDSFESFIESVGEKPSPQHTLDRIDNEGNYEPSNCRWATRSQQQSNRRPLSNDHGYKGISFQKGKWKASLGINKTLIYLGRFDTPEQAAKAYNIAAFEAFGEYALLNDV